jgi:hypothetical protein
MPNALITGSGARASDVAAALESGGFAPTLRADSATKLVDVCLSVPLKSLDCYIQLPDDHAARATAVTEASAMIAEGGLARYEAMARVAPLLTDAATVVLVMGDRALDEPRPDLAGALADLTRVLARALRDDYRDTGVRVALVGDRHSASEIASIARSEGPPPPPPGSSGAPPDVAISYADLEPDLGFAEWRLEVLSLLETT